MWIQISYPLEASKVGLSKLWSDHSQQSDLLICPSWWLLSSCLLTRWAMVRWCGIHSEFDLVDTVMNVGKMFQPKSLNPIWTKWFPSGHLPNMMFNMDFCDRYVFLRLDMLQLFFQRFNLTSSFIKHHRRTPQMWPESCCLCKVFCTPFLLKLSPLSYTLLCKESSCHYMFHVDGHNSQPYLLLMPQYLLFGSQCIKD